MKRLISFSIFTMFLTGCLPADPYTLRAAADSLIEGTRVAQTETAEAVVRENQAAVLQQMQTQAASDNAATATAHVVFLDMTATALFQDAQATQGAATAQAVAGQETRVAVQTQSAFEGVQTQAAATLTQQAAMRADEAEAARLGREKVVTVLMWGAVFVAIGLIIFLAVEFARMFTRSMGKQRAWVPGAEAFVLDSQAGPVLVQPRKMFGPGLQVSGRSGELAMPQLAAPDAQMYTTLAALAVELQREVSKRAQWLTPQKNGQGEAFAPMVDQGSVPQLPAPRELAPLPMLAGRHVLILGGTGDGKTHTARYLLQGRKSAYILDPHRKPGEWPEHCRVIGGGRNFGAIATTIHEVYALMDGRFKQRNLGNAIFNPVHLVTDELPAIVKSEPGTADELMQIGREGRKVGVFLIILTQSLRVKTLGIEGEGDALRNFATVMLNGLRPGQPEDSPRTCTVVVGDFKRPESKEDYIVPARLREVPKAGSDVPGEFFDVPQLLEETGKSPLGTGFPTSGTPPEPGSQAEAELIRQLDEMGFSVERIFGLLGGRKEKTTARVRAVLGVVSTTDDTEGGR